MLCCGVFTTSWVLQKLFQEWEECTTCSIETKKGTASPKTFQLPSEINKLKGIGGKEVKEILDSLLATALARCAKDGSPKNPKVSYMYDF